MYDDYSFGVEINGKRVGLFKTILAELLLLVIGIIIFIFVSTPVTTKGYITNVGQVEVEKRQDWQRVRESYLVATYVYTIGGKEYSGEYKNPIKDYEVGQEVTVYLRIFSKTSSSLFNESIIGYIVLGSCGGLSLVFIVLTLIAYAKFKKYSKAKEFVEYDSDAIERKRIEDLKALAESADFGTKQCPYCNSVINLGDIKCPRCGADLSQN